MTDEPNEILAAAAEAKAHEEGASHAKREARKRNWNIGKIGLGVGIGSAAVAAAVLFANRDKK
ncbi:MULTISPECIES: hypothetical protein [Sphingomonas]|uniref:Uncharacterized protein n=1 Tax=Sphingomonas lycopersici TaxID=2951807 RepID=A0AA42CVG7_9SPHN|nr:MULTISPECIES: hypothetical protein [Sphingomonas]MCW6532382.1 hypothetical protein [Sphingomonas lycopersici]MCW6536571.1 hypothetical protein [Sphingomonas lycopersici]OJU18568.1 MAG: hypothetical protein BGN95_15250 [Sphingomonas sp. 66-10]